MDARMLEMWLRMSADAVRGTDQAQRAVKSLGEGPLSPAALSSWLSMWMPDAATTRGGGTDPVGELRQIVEQWWSLLGVVPLHQYQELRDRHEELKRRLEEAETTITRLRTTLAVKGYEEEARGLLDSWEQITHQTLAAQAEWAAQWMGGPAEQPASATDTDDEG